MDVFVKFFLPKTQKLELTLKNTVRAKEGKYFAYLKACQLLKDSYPRT
jgi:hypothetical protein